MRSLSPLIVAADQDKRNKKDVGELLTDQLRHLNTRLRSGVIQVNPPWSVRGCCK